MHPRGPIFSHLGENGQDQMGFFQNLVFPNAFCVVPLCSHQVLNDYLICSQFVPQVSNMFPIAAHFIPYVLPKVFFLKFILSSKRKY